MSEERPQGRREPLDLALPVRQERSRSHQQRGRRGPFLRSGWNGRSLPRVGVGAAGQWSGSFYPGPCRRPSRLRVPAWSGSAASARRPPGRDGASRASRVRDRSLRPPPGCAWRRACPAATRPAPPATTRGRRRWSRSSSVRAVRSETGEQPHSFQEGNALRAAALHLAPAVEHLLQPGGVDLHPLAAQQHQPGLGGDQAASIPPWKGSGRRAPRPGRNPAGCPRPTGRRRAAGRSSPAPGAWPVPWPSTSRARAPAARWLPAPGSPARSGAPPPGSRPAAGKRAGTRSVRGPVRCFARKPAAPGRAAGPGPFYSSRRRTPARRGPAGGAAPGHFPRARACTSPGRRRAGPRRACSRRGGSSPGPRRATAGGASGATRPTHHSRWFPARSARRVRCQSAASSVGVRNSAPPRMGGACKANSASSPGSMDGSVTAVAASPPAWQSRCK